MLHKYFFGRSPTSGLVSSLCGIKFLNIQFSKTSVILSANDVVSHYCSFVSLLSSLVLDLITKYLISNMDPTFFCCCLLLLLLEKYLILRKF